MTDRLIFIPGRECRASEDYPKTWAGLEDAGFEVDEIVPPWGTTFENLVTHTSGELAGKLGHAAVVVAHSFGANIALPELARQTNVSIVLASPSVACTEGVQHEAGRSIVKKYFPGQTEFVSQFSLVALAGAIQIPPEQAAVLVGEVEARSFPYMNDLAGIAAQALRVQVTQVPAAPHFIDNSEQYIQAIVDAATSVRENRIQ